MDMKKPTDGNPWASVFFPLGCEFHTVIDFSERQVCTNLLERQNGIQALIDFAIEAMVGPSVGHDRRSFLVNEDVNAQSGDGLVRVLLFTFVNAAGLARENFKKRRGLVLKGIVLWIWPADDGNVGIIKPRLVRQ